MFSEVAYPANSVVKFRVDFFSQMIESSPRVSIPDRVLPTDLFSGHSAAESAARIVEKQSTFARPSPPAIIDASFLEMLHDPAIVIEPYSKIILAANARACDTYSASLVGENAPSIWVDATRESRMLAEVLSNGSVKGFNTVHRGSSSDEIAISCNARLITFEGKTAVLSINLDVSERERTQRAIMLANVEWRDTVDAVLDMIILEDQFGKIRRCNRTSIEFIGKTYQEVIGTRLENVLEPAHGSEPDYLRRLVWEGSFEGRHGWFEVKNHRVKTENGTGNVWVHVIKDITAQRRAEEERLKLYTVIEQASDGTMIVDILGTIEYVNKVAERSLGISRGDLVGTSVSAVKTEITAEVLRDEIFPHLEEQNFWRTTNQIDRGNETIFEEVTVSRVVDSQGRPINYVFVFRDVTETRQLESIAGAVNLMENVGYVFSGIRHELGNPINSVKMALTVLEKNYQTWDHEQVHLFISRCLQELGRVEYLLRTLKNFSLHESAAIEEIDVAEFLKHFVSFAKGDFEKRGIDIVIKAAVKRKALCDPRALHQVMINLLANAADALSERDSPNITITASESRNWIHVTVDDNGIGMTDKQLGNLFKPFYTSKPNGTGLGLVIVQKMLANMAGTINIESKYEEGTQVHIALKAAK
jgi:PAS domain S-box-containing protein